VIPARPEHDRRDAKQQRPARDNQRNPPAHASMLPRGENLRRHASQHCDTDFADKFCRPLGLACCCAAGGWPGYCHTRENPWDV
jgi:hypothetical protein